MAKYYTDGWMMGTNPSPYGGGFTVMDSEGKLIIREEIHENGFTNNEAEIRGIKYALEYAVSGDTVSTDSMCCLSWVNKGKSKARGDLFELLQECNYLLKSKGINLVWEGREFNLAGVYNEKGVVKFTHERIAKKLKLPEKRIESKLQTTIRLLSEEKDKVKELELEIFLLKAKLQENEDFFDKLYN